MIGASGELPDGYRVLSYEQLASTNDEAVRLAGEGVPEGTIVQAAVQTNGRGRRGRSWVSPEGNLYCSTIFRPQRPMGEVATLSFAVALAVAETVALFAPADRSVMCKWPNDVLVDRAKIAGILLECGGNDADGVCWIVAGIGINVRHHPRIAAYPAVALADFTDHPPEPDEVLVVLASLLAKWYEVWRNSGFAAVREAWLKRAIGLNQIITAKLFDRALVGVFAGLDLDGVLLLEQDGVQERISAGDVFFPSLEKE